MLPFYASPERMPFAVDSVESMTNAAVAGLTKGLARDLGDARGIERDAGVWGGMSGR